MRLQQIHEAQGSFNRAFAPISVAAELPHLLASGTADSPLKSAVSAASRRARRLWGREDGFTTAGLRR